MKDPIIDASTFTDSMSTATSWAPEEKRTYRERKSQPHTTLSKRHLQRLKRRYADMLAGNRHRHYR